jgi:hypothetical protein
MNNPITKLREASEKRKQAIKQALEAAENVKKAAEASRGINPQKEK